MGPLEALLVLEEILPAAFPERAAEMIRIAERWLWFDSVPAATPPDEHGTRVFPEALLCDWCGRNGDFVYCLVAASTALHEGESVRWPPELYDFASSRAPAFRLCQACCKLGLTPGHDDVVLADIERAIVGSEDGGIVRDELVRAASHPRVVKRATKQSCALCRKHALSGSNGIFLCEACLANLLVVEPRTGGLRAEPIIFPPHMQVGMSVSYPTLVVPGAVVFPQSELWVEHHGPIATSIIRGALAFSGEIVLLPAPARSTAELPLVVTVARIVGQWDEALGGIDRRRDPRSRLAGFPHPPDPPWLMLVVGTHRLEVRDIHHGRIEGVVLPPDDDDPAQDWSEYHALRDAFYRFITAHLFDENRLDRVMDSALLDRSTWIAANVAPATAAERLAILQDLDLRSRVIRVRALLERELDVAALEKKILARG